MGKELDPDIEFQKCIGQDIYSLFMEAENLLDNHIMKIYGIIQEEDLEEGYKSYISSWKGKINEGLFIDMSNNLENEKRILENPKIGEILDWSLNMGDSIYILAPGETERLLNELQINYEGKLIECLKESVDSVAINYLELKSLGDIKYMGIAEPLLNYLTKENLENDILKKLIVLELYLRPLANEKMKK